MNKTAIVASMVLGLVAVSGTAFAWNGGLGLQNDEAVMNAIDNGDYEAWKVAVEETLTEENFDRIMEMQQDREMRRENMETVRQAIENEDYKAWKLAIQNMEQNRMSEMTEEQFNAMVQMHEARMNGDFGTANQLREEFGIGPRPCGFDGMQMGRMR